MHRNIWLLGLVSLLMDISSEMVYPLMPLFLVGALGATPAIVGWIEGIAESLASLLRVYAGAWSDYFNRRKPLAIAGYGLSGLSRIMLAFAGSWMGVLFVRVFDRFGKGIRSAPRDALLAESASPEERGKAFGLHKMMDSFGAVIGVLLAYLLVTLYLGVSADWSSIFLWAAVPALGSVVMLSWVKESGKKGDGKCPKPVLFSPVAAWRALNAKTRWFLIFIFLFSLGNSSNVFLLLKAQQLGMTTTDILLLYLCYNVVLTLVAYPAGRLSDRFGRRVWLVGGYFTYAVVYLGLSFTQSVAWLWVWFAVYGLYSGLTGGVEKAFLADEIPPDQKATAFGLYHTLVGLGLLPASVLAGWLWSTWGSSAAFGVGAALGLAAAVGIGFVTRDG
ncbi:MAG: MFS transporter [Clostridia bacterium]|nr:MFS transporter [Clostridia bacterium]